MHLKQLFLGFKVDSSTLIAESKDQDSLYLTCVCVNGVNYVGKLVGPICDLSSLLLLEKNIISLSQYLFSPHLTPEQLVLLTLENSNG